jgi:hypothetical protein
MADLSPAHMQARTVLHQSVNHGGTIYHPQYTQIFLPSLPRFDASERALASKWKAYLKWEESNPLEIDRATLITRIQVYIGKPSFECDIIPKSGTEFIVVFPLFCSPFIFPQLHGLHLDE